MATNEVYDQVAPASARVAIDSVIGMCLVHGWWFGLDAQRVVACPEPDCQADVQLYERARRVPYLSPIGPEPQP